jgi:hypothetical protein
LSIVHSFSKLAVNEQQVTDAISSAQLFEYAHAYYSNQLTFTTER